MRSTICIGISVFLFITFPAVAQRSSDVDATDLIGFWQTDSAAQLGAKLNRLANTDSLDDRVVSDGTDRAIISREYGFFDNGMFTAQWLLGTKPTVVNGTWGIVSENKIFIKLDGIMAEYAVNRHGKDGIILVPQRERRGVVHELYFTRQEEK